MRIAILLLSFAIAIQAAPKVQIKSLTCTMGLTSGQVGTCVVTLTKAAPKGGAAFIINLKPSPFASLLLVPAMNVTVPQGQISTAFPIMQR